MRWVSLVASLLLGVAFVLAGAAKLAMGKRWPAMAAGLGAPLLTIGFVPWIELVVGAALLAQLVEPVPALIAIWMLLAYTALITKRLAEGKRPPCACFGTWSPRPIGAAHLARNVGLLVLGLLALYP